jgi:RNA polymerase sigma factor for flagellar operon FliA
MVEKMATAMSRRIPESVERDELVAAGFEGLVRAAKRFEHGRGVRFSTFASFHVRGSMIEHLRHLDIMSRNDRRVKNSISRAVDRLGAQLGREPDEEEVAEALDMSVTDYRAIRSRLGEGRLVSIPEPGADTSNRGHGLQLRSGTPDPEELMIGAELPRKMWAAVAQLPERKRLVIELAHRDSLTFKEIGQRLGVSESRVSQLRQAAIRDLKKRLVPGSSRNPGRHPKHRCPNTETIAAGANARSA